MSGRLALSQSILGFADIGYPMDTGKLDELVLFLTDRVGDDLRTVTRYSISGEGYEIVYARDDVLEQYEEETIDKIIYTYEMDSIGKAVEEDRYEHGEMSCVVRCFEDGIEINLLGDDSGGVVIGLEAGTFLAHNTFVGKCMEIVGITNG